MDYFHKKRVEEESQREIFYGLLKQAKVPSDIWYLVFERWRRAVAKAVPKNIPLLQPLTSSSLQLSQLPQADPRAFLAGGLIDCCMAPHRAASGCNWHGHESANGTFWVTENMAQEPAQSIVAVAWVWRWNTNLVVDSVEISKEYKTDGEYIFDMYLQAARSMQYREGIEHVFIGAEGGSSGLASAHFHKRAVARAFTSPAPYIRNVDGAQMRCDDSRNVYRLC